MKTQTGIPYQGIKLAFADCACVVGLVCLCGVADALGAAARQVPVPLAGHPGQVFLEGEAVELSVPPLREGPRIVRDYEGRQVLSVAPVGGMLDLGRLPVGYYTLEPVDTTGEASSLGVVARLQAPIPQDSPVALDVAMAWFYPPEKMDAVSSLCALAGVNWVRDRLS